MSIERTATIVVTLDSLGIEEKKYVVGTEEEIYAEAHDFMNEVVMRFIEDEDIEDFEEQYLIADCAIHTIVWDEWSPAPFAMYAVIESDNWDHAVHGVYPTRADAEEALVHECETFAYEVMMTADPRDVFGTLEWDWDADYKWLVKDALQAFEIFEVPVYGVREVIR